MKKFNQQLTPDAILKIIGGEAALKKTVSLNSIADPREAEPNSVIFLDSDNYVEYAIDSKAGLKIIGNKFKNKFSKHMANIIFVENSYHSVLILMKYWQEKDKSAFESNIHPSAIIGANVKLPEKVSIGPYVLIGDDVSIGEYSRIDSFCTIEKDSKIGKNCHLYPNVTIYEDTQVGDDVYIHSGSVIGADGFGYILQEGIQSKIPQIGRVIIHNNVEIGANTTIDRGTIGPTIIGEGTKIDNLVQIGHNCIVGKHSILCAQVGLAGSTIIGDYVYLAGQVGVAGHLEIGNQAMVGAQSGVAGSLKAGEKYFGTPAREAMHMKKIIASENSLPDIYKLFNKIKKERGQEM